MRNSSVYSALIFASSIVLLTSGCASLFGSAAPRRELVLEREWVRSTIQDTTFAARRTHRMTPISYESLIIEGNAVDGITAYNRESGTVAWRLDIENGVEGGAQVAEGKLFFGAGDGQFYAISPENGRILWTFPVHAETLAPPTIDRGSVYFQSGADLVYSLDASTGKQNWLYNRQSASSLSIRATTRPTVDGDLVYAGFSDGYVAAISRTSGALQWEKKLSRNLRFKDVDSTPVVDGDTIYISSYDGSLYALNKTTGNVLWELEEGGYTPVTANKDVLYYATTTGNVYALEKATGRKIWTTKLARGIATQPVLLGNYVVYGESEGNLVVSDSRTGSELSKFAPGRGILATPLVNKNNEIYFISTNGNLFSMRLALRNVNDRLPWHKAGL
jgi:outer membrane protein assembly factor BamB